MIDELLISNILSSIKEYFDLTYCMFTFFNIIDMKYWLTIQTILVAPPDSVQSADDYKDCYQIIFGRNFSDTQDDSSV